MKIAIVILNWNGVNLLKEYLPSVIRYSVGADVWVADNASTDSSLALLKSEFPMVRLVQLDKNYGFAGGYNNALKEISADYYVILNSDVEVTDGWLAPLIKYMESHPDVAACQPKLLSILDKGLFEYAGASGGFLDSLGYPYCRGRIFDVVEADRGQYDDICEIMWATGACLVIRSKDFWNIQGFDERFFAHNEEIDLCWRLRNLGRKIVVIPQSVVYHFGGATLPQGNPQKTFLNFRNNLLMLYKNLPNKELGRVMSWRWLLDYLAAWQTLLVNRNVGDFKAIYRARWAFKRMLSEFKSDREQIQATRKVTSRDIEVLPSILCKYYFCKKKFFSNL
ncbi:glycosyltransferase family 2 protein [Prevotella sp. S7 MS 2]|uniref:glycosyltransferase family 2 protein n=1 Tax=Prevotella sp. S7 MS 2 TaxID=1287488 RepID=UPI000512F5A0|nr:glycosyltransferase family 2 protein [Prevotella sp. S7 MS 2]KGI59609.1 glycosyl transferase family 2 [Prevotella sp. S7 MS 2]